MKKPAIADGPNLKFSSYAVALTDTKICNSFLFSKSNRLGRLLDLPDRYPVEVEHHGFL